MSVTVARKQSWEKVHNQHSGKFFNFLPPLPFKRLSVSRGFDHRAVFSSKSLWLLLVLLICGHRESREVLGGGRKCLVLAGKACQGHFSC